MTGRRRLEDVYNELSVESLNGHELWARTLSLLDLRIELDKNLEDLYLPGPVVLLANHPFGVADGLSMGYMLSKIKEDVLLMVNEVLCREPVLSRYFLPIDFRPDKRAIQTNIKTRKKALNHIHQGGSLGIFPSGAVSTVPSIWHQKAVDLEWKSFVVKLTTQPNVHILPVLSRNEILPYLKQKTMSLGPI